MGRGGPGWLGWTGPAQHAVLACLHPRSWRRVCCARPHPSRPHRVCSPLPLLAPARRRLWPRWWSSPRRRLWWVFLTLLNFKSLRFYAAVAAAGAAPDAPPVPAAPPLLPPLALPGWCSPAAALRAAEPRCLPAVKCPPGSSAGHSGHRPPRRGGCQTSCLSCMCTHSPLPLQCSVICPPVQ